ncbi:sulfate/molybdate ABC transporter ATP-binding protein [Saliterribacillus persicus]|uniref:Carnitine transport ATP-binding protein OpuCA n=1 Tax=Saliterribacillus persicus TaxID=930114 RepID=A0A368YBT9_9BACI|nr:ABC transporter ATP-binding protein [Saliterribacillus persicus]RCW76898.1 molybdate transport system ATP-binding protein [Saliterribacillus persicus]
MLDVKLRKILSHFSLELNFKANKGITAIIGPSGSGKSMTLQCISGLEKPEHGEINLNNEILYSEEKKINRKPRVRRIGYVFQNYALFPHLTVEKNIGYGLQHLSKEDKNKRVEDILAKVELSAYKNRYPHELSGGQQQRVALARTLVTEPDLLLLDEPFSALDHHVKYKLEKELLTIIKENFHGIVLLVTHNMEEAYRLSDHLIIMDEGKILQSGERDTVFYQPRVKRAAEIIGCKNIFPINKSEGSDTYEVNGVPLNCKYTLREEPHYIGIYAQHITFVDKESTLTNTFSFEVVECIKGLHQSQLVIRVEKALTLNVSIPNHEAEKLSSDTNKVYLDPAHLFLLS